MIARGEPWGTPTSRPAERIVRGSDADLAAALAGRASARIRFEPDTDSDLARSIGIAAASLGPADAPSVELPLDVLELSAAGDEGMIAVNAVVLGAPPAQLRWGTLSTPIQVDVDGRMVFAGKATTVVIATGQYVTGDDLVPRGHPGDGRAEIQVYAVARGERKAMRARLGSGAHVPHPGITEATGRAVTVRAPARMPLTVDGRPRGTPEELRAHVRPGHLVLVL